MTTPHESLPRAARKMLGHLTDQYRKNKRPMCAEEICIGAYVSPSHGRTMLKVLREAGLITYVGTAEQAGRKDLQAKVAMFGPIGMAMLPRLVRPLDERDKKELPENHSLGARYGANINPQPKRPKKQRYNGEKMPPQYVPQFREITPQDHNLWSARDLAMLAR